MSPLRVHRKAHPQIKESALQSSDVGGCPLPFLGMCERKGWPGMIRQRRHASRATMWLRVVGTAIPFACGIGFAAYLSAVDRHALQTKPALALAGLLLLGVVTGVVMRTWVSVLVVPVALFAGLKVGGTLSLFHNVTWLWVIGYMDLFVLSIVLVLIPAAIGAAIGTAMGITMTHQRAHA